MQGRKVARGRKDMHAGRKDIHARSQGHAKPRRIAFQRGHSAGRKDMQCEAIPAFQRGHSANAARNAERGYFRRHGRRSALMRLLWTTYSTAYAPSGVLL